MSVDLGFIGAGFMGQVAHLSNYTRVDGCDVVALAEPQEKLATEVARRYGVPEMYRDHEALLDEEDIDAVVAVQPFRRHEYIVPEILRADLPVFTEKPLAAKPETGEMMVELADERDLVHMVGYHKRSDPAMEYAREVIDDWRQSNEYGEMQYVRLSVPLGDWYGGAPDPITTDETPPEGGLEEYPSQFDARTAEAYRTFIGYYIHQINLLHLVFGESYDITWADDRGTVMAVESESGVAGSLELAPYTLSDDWHESVFVGFERGYVRVDLAAPLASQEAGRVEIMRDDGDSSEIVTPTMPPVAAMRRQAENFLASVRGERRPPCESREAVDDIRMAVEYIDSVDSDRLGSNSLYS